MLPSSFHCYQVRGSQKRRNTHTARGEMSPNHLLLVDPDQLSAWSQASASPRCLLSAIPHVSLQSSGA